jgi:predicted nucleic-acid-binding protein
MRSVDTNIIVRFLTHDDESQFQLAKVVFGGGDVWIAKTVLLETVWVLRSKYLFTPHAAIRAVRELLGIDGVAVEDVNAVERALSLVDQGIDFADALHLASRPDGAHFITFDEAFVRKAKRVGVTRISNAAH